ncbi:MAG: VanW family protein, partial [Kiritimatiellia bacterium]
GLDVVERRPHSRVVPYVPPGRDATVAYGITDFRFRNSNSSPVAVVSKVTRSHLTIGIYGAAADKRDIEIFTSRPKYTGRGRRTVASGSVAPGGSRVLDPGASGVSVVVYRRIKSADGTVVTEVVSRDRYPAQSAVVAVGRSRGSASSGAPSPLHAASGAGATGAGVN